MFWEETFVPPKSRFDLTARMGCGEEVFGVSRTLKAEAMQRARFQFCFVPEDVWQTDIRNRERKCCDMRNSTSVFVHEVCGCRAQLNKEAMRLVNACAYTTMPHRTNFIRAEPTNSLRADST